MGSKTKFKTDYMVLSGLLVATIFWLIDSILHIFFFNEFDIILQLIGPNQYNIAIRMIVLCLFVLFGSHAQYTINARKKAEQELVDYKNSLEEAVRQGTCKLQEMNEQMRQEISERKRMESAVRESEEKYRLLVENANEAIFILQDDQVKFTNPKADEIITRLSLDPTKPDLTRLIHAQEREKVIEWYQRRLKGMELPYSFMFRLEGPRSVSIWVELNSILIKLNGKPATLNFMRDVTLQKKLEEQFYQSQKMESIGTLAGGIAHDFNNLLMGIQGNVSVMNLEVGAADPLQESIDSIARCVKSGSQLTNQLLAFARGGKYVVTPSNLNTIVYKTAEIFGRTKKEIDLHPVFAKDIWPVEVDPSQIEQVLMNLYVNAWQAMPEGGDLYIELENVRLDEHYARIKPFNIRPGRFVKLSVTDTGVGMTPETQKRIFEPFFSTKEKGMGTGLGLASAYGIIKNHNGFINCYSELGHGTTFNVYFPVCEETYPPEDGGADGELVEGVPGGDETILFVDDDEEIITVGRKILASLGYTVLVASGGQAAVDLFIDQQDRIALVILDYVMPGMGGREVFETLKQIQPEVKVLLSSGYSSTDQVAALIEKGCRGFIQKPYDTVKMSRTIRTILDGVAVKPAEEN
ncbi:MAG: response regulator [Deltaproteobacteria bacterium]|nr:response regulator [Deltaproteobacteria bacterium]